VRKLRGDAVNVIVTGDEDEFDGELIGDTQPEILDRNRVSIPLSYCEPLDGVFAQIRKASSDAGNSRSRATWRSLGWRISSIIQIPSCTASPSLLRVRLPGILAVGPAARHD